MEEDIMEEKGVEASLGSYTLGELANNSLPSNFEDHPYPISLESGEDEYSQTIKNLSETTVELGRLEGEKYAYAGSMAMYLLWHDLMEQRKEIDIKPTLIQRIKGGKNDCDLSVEPNRDTIVMQKLGFDEESIEKKRGVVGKHMLDILTRTERPSFPNKKVKINGEEVFVQDPYSSLFEKVSALAYSQKDNQGNEVKKQIKWGVDLKLYKLYIQLSENISEDDLNQKLKDLWPKYQSEERDVYLKGLALKVENGRSPVEVLGGILKIDTPTQESILDSFKSSYPDVEQEQIIRLLNSFSAETFTENAKGIFKTIYKDSDSYQQAFERAEENYKNLF